ncbi:secreted RxLR effector protein 161-like [Nicotiana tabacum]|uniref:Secreted RxLR effector protein 161-like n=1 Tax=Nicotiana tabacum TaxID=4097 RepID=A0AC58TPS0_TOBAC
MKDLGEVDTILGVKVKRHSGGFALCQPHYIDKVLSKFNHLSIKAFNTPFDASSKMVENPRRSVSQLDYASAIGSLMYVMHCTRPDIAFAICKLSRYNHTPSGDHWKGIVKALGYLKKTKTFALYYNTFLSVLEGYCDASWITSIGDNKSTSRWIFTLCGGAISWDSKKQTCITHSIMEFEFIALAAAGREAEWLRNLLLDIKLWPHDVSPAQF